MSKLIPLPGVTYESIDRLAETELRVLGRQIIIVAQNFFAVPDSITPSAKQTVLQFATSTIAIMAMTSGTFWKGVQN